jgi:hypothetical protein
VLRPVEALPFKEHEKVQVTVQAKASPLLQAQGILHWTGDMETLERSALDAEYLPEEAP